MRVSAARLWAVFVVVLVLLLAGLLVGPRVPANEQQRYCVANLVTSSPFGLSITCDAFLNLHIAREPERLLDKGSFRQSRPLLAVPAYLLRPLFLWARDAPEWLGIRPAPDIQEYYLRFTPAMFANDFPAYLAYVLINLLELAAAFAVYLLLVMGSATGRDWRASSPAVVAVGAVGLLLIANDVVKVFALHPHVQMFNILAPLLGVLVLARPAGSAKRAALIGLGAGIGILAYPLMVIVAGCHGLRLLFELQRDRDLRAFLARAALVIAGTAIPVLGWYWFVLWQVGSFHSGELRYRQVLWIADSFVAGTLIADLATFFGALLGKAILQSGALVAMLVLAAWLLRRAGARLALDREERETVAAAIVTSIVVLIFHALAGFCMARVAYGLLPPLIVVCGVFTRVVFEEAPAHRARGVAAAFVLVVTVQLVHTVVKAQQFDG